MQAVKRLLRNVPKTKIWFQNGNKGSNKEISTTAVRRDAATLAKLKNLQAKFQVEDGRPIFLKAGLRDRILYIATLLGCAVGLFESLHTIYDHAKPPSWR